jgi:glycosyltransferase involved in cell wall biosynthesis
MVRPQAKEAPRVSVVLPTYNQAHYLPQALDSVLNQTWRDFELVVVNDGSTDETPRILDEYQRRYGIKVVHQENRKLPGALNTGFRLARGQYLTWTSSDNIMRPRMLEVLVGALDRHPEVGLVYADWEIIDEQGEIVGTVRTFDFDRHLLMRINYINACFLYRRACQEAVGLYDSGYVHVEDWEYWLRISRRFAMMRVPEVLYQYRVHGESLTSREVRSQPEEQSEGYRRLAVVLRSQPLAWYFSKLKWEWLRLRLGRDPREYLRFGTDRGRGWGR